MDQPMPLGSRAGSRIRPHQTDAYDAMIAWRAPEPRHPRFGAANDMTPDPIVERAPDETADRIVQLLRLHRVALYGAAASALLGAWMGSLLHL